MRTLIPCVYVCVVALMLPASSWGAAEPVPAAAGFAGKFSDGKLTLDWNTAGAAGTYSGTITSGGRTFPASARGDGRGLVGSFESGGARFDFNATLVDGDTVTLVSGRTTYRLKRVAPPAVVAPANPLDDADPAVAAGPATRDAAGGVAAAAVGDAPAGYAVVTTTDAGRALAARKADVTSARAALESTLADLGRYFDAKLTVNGAYEDAQSHRAGGASFAAKLKGQPVNGWVSCKVDDAGAAVAVVYCRADAPRAEWDKLTAAPAAPAAAPPEGKDGAPATEVKLEPYAFPDGTGTIGLAEGWRTKAPSCIGAVEIEGPADQRIGIGRSLNVQTPDSPMLQTQRQLEANARRMGIRPPAPLPVLVAPYGAPVDALKNLAPQLSQFSQRAGGPAVTIDKLVQTEEAKPSLPNGRAAIVTYAVTRTQGGSDKHYRAMARVETSPLGPAAWMLYLIEVLAPDATYDRDLPVMLAMTRSLKTNDAVIAQKTQQNIQQSIDAQNRNFAALQQAHRDQVAGFDRANKAWAQRQNAQSRSNADFVEVIRGYRTVQDTRTGERTSVDLGNVDGIVNRLNEGDPGHYQQIPLRDETAPIGPGR